jgi:ATP-dependent helicase/nuclease subunit B
MTILKPPVSLNPARPLASQVAAHLLEGCEGVPVDLSDTLVIVPTTGAARGIRAALAAATSGVLSPGFRLPMEALLPRDSTTAAPVERLAAWVQVLRRAPRSRFAALIPPAVKLSAAEDWIGVATRLIEVCDTLAEAGLSPADEQIAALCPADIARWTEFGELHEDYNSLLNGAGRPDPNELRRVQAVDPTPPPGIRRIVIAAAPDLPAVSAQWLEALEKQGVLCEVLCAPSGAMEAPVDPWGRPDPEWWLTHSVPVPEEVLVVENDTASEAMALAGFAAKHGGGGFGLVSAAPETATALEAEVARRGAVSYLPEGRPLRQTEPATIITAWDDFRRTGRLRTLRPLLQLPLFLRLLSEGTDLSAADAGTACDRLLAEKLCTTLEAAAAWSRADQSAKPDAVVIRRFVAAAQALVARDLQGQALLAALYAPDEPAEAHTAAELETLVEALDEADTSPLLAEFSPDWREALHRGLLMSRRVFTAAPEGAVEIHGWLEAPWIAAPVLCVAGCREGALPSGVTEDAFLPDALREKLGLPCQKTRFARDACILSGLLAMHGPERLRLGFSRFRPEGEPNRPSRLLFGCTEEELPARVEKIFQPAPTSRRLPAARPAWKLHLDPPPPVASIRVTGFKHYLECPLRFCLSQVKKLQPFDPEQREINPPDYGTLLHRVVENFHQRGPADSTDEKTIADWLDRELDAVVAGHYGRHPAPVVRVQAGSMRVRLRHLAALQAAGRRAGWRIIESEYAVPKDDGFTIGPLALTGTMDRVEVHDELGLRVLDYKTFNTTKTPEDTHFGPPRPEGEFPAADITRRDKRDRAVERSWTDLQLPLYRRLAAKIWPEQAAKGLGTGYILLPGDPDDTQIALLDIDGPTQAAAERCAEAVARRVADGVFWPPAAKVDYDNFAEWFGGGHPRDVFDAETIAALEGRP